MNLKKFIKAICIAVLCFTFAPVSAQVTIGSGIEPNAGALLDLKQTDAEGENSKLGLLLSKVTLTSLSTFGLLSTEPTTPEIYKGLVVFHESSQPNPPINRGLYIWDGRKWVLTPSKQNRDETGKI